jgi:class 3 adenylate cyclase
MKYTTARSFCGKTRVVLALLGIIPFLLIVYLFVFGGMALSETVILFSALALLSILGGFSLMRASADQLVTLVRQTALVKEGGTFEPFTVKADEELNDIAEHFNSLALKLRQANRDIKEQSVQLMTYARDLSFSYQKLKEEEAVRKKLSRYVGENLIEKLLNTKVDVFPENERNEVSILFADIRSFTVISERMRPEDVLSMLNQYFGAMVEIIFKNNGILDKFVGDQAMALFGVIPGKNGGPWDAVSAAIQMQRETAALMEIRASEGKETFQVGIGINTGHAIIGNVGSENRMDYTVIGNSVNVAAKLEQMARGGEIIIGEETYAQTRGRFPISRKMQLAIKDRKEPLTFYKIDSL